MAKPASVHRGTLLRWFEELCRIKHQKLGDIVRKSQRGLEGGHIPPKGGVYAFWWTGPPWRFRSKQFQRVIHLYGPGGISVPIAIDTEWLGLDARLPVPLYLGKTTSGLNRRVGQHLKLKTDQLLKTYKGKKKAPAPTTSCQLRAGVERLFPTNPDSRKLVLENVGLSYVLLDGPGHAVNRFYLENLAIGMMQPPLNIDVER